MSTTYRANVIRSGDDGIWVAIPALGDAEFGPLEALASDKVILAKYEIGDRVLVQQVGAIPEDFIILGHAIRTQKTPPPWNIGSDEDIEIDASQVVSGTLSPGRIPDLSASKITSGTFYPPQIPPLDASRINTGTFSVSRIPDLGTSKITSGVFPAARIPDLSASKITSGELSTSRIPDLSASKIAYGELAPARIPSLDASKIGSGTLPVARGGRGYTTDWVWIPENPYFYSNYYIRARDGVFEYQGYFAPKSVTLTGPVGLGIIPPNLRIIGDSGPVSIIPVYVNRPGIGLYSVIAANGDLGVYLSPYQGSVLLYGDNQIVPIIPPYTVVGA